MTANPRLRAAIAVAVVVVALGLAWVLGRATRPDTTAATQPAGSSTPVVTPTSPTGTPTPTVTPSLTKTPTPSTSSTAPRSAVESGLTKDFGYTKSSRTVDGYVHLSFDRAILLTGAAANAYAAAHGMATPVPNDYLVAGDRGTSAISLINDSKKLRDLVLSPDVKITGNVLLAGTGTGDPSPVSLATFLAKVKADPTIPVHITYDKNLLVTKIDEQFFP